MPRVTSLGREWSILAPSVTISGKGLTNVSNSVESTHLKTVPVTWAPVGLFLYLVHKPHPNSVNLCVPEYGLRAGRNPQQPFGLWRD